MKIYLDVDGVLLGKHGVAAGAEEFIAYVVDHFDCYWLTTHCHGDANTVLKYLRKYVDDATYQRLTRVRPTNFAIFKSEVLSPEDDFIWIEDKLLVTEIDWLQSHSKMASWWQVDTYKDPDALRACTAKLKMLAERGPEAYGIAL